MLLILEIFDENDLRSDREIRHDVAKKLDIEILSSSLSDDQMKRLYHIVEENMVGGPWKRAKAINASSPTKSWIRTCQECGSTQRYKSPHDYTTDSWTETKCKKCHSIALDYGKEEPSGKEPQETKKEGEA
jgi:hypothetical protein